jgi:hypothetical protein
MGVVSFTSLPLHPQGKRPWYPFDRRLGGPQSQSGRGGKEKNSQTLLGLEPPIIQPVAQSYTTELSRVFNQHSYEINIQNRAVIISCKSVEFHFGSFAKDSLQN